ncbi:hypothetical protein Tco_0447738 [Tanacetum coccineum]
MTRSIVKKPTEPLEEPERELHRRRKAACRQQRNESLAIAERNLFDDEASSSANSGPNPSSSLKSLREHTSPNSSSFQNPIVLPAEQTGNILDSRDIWLIQGATRTSVLVRRDIYDDPSLLRFYQNDNIPPWGNIRHKAKGEEGPEWVTRSKFEDKLSDFMLEKSLHAKGLGEMLNQHRNEMHEQFSQILTTIEKRQTPTPKPDAPTFTITTRSRTTTHDPPYPTPPSATTLDNTKRIIEEEEPEGEETTTTQGKETPQSHTLYHPSKSSGMPFPSRLKKQQRDDDDERLFSIFRQIHINLPLFEVIIHMPKGSKVLKDLLLHKEKLKKSASSVKLNEECSAII